MVLGPRDLAGGEISRLGPGKWPESERPHPSPVFRLVKIGACFGPDLAENDIFIGPQTIESGRGVTP